MSRQYKAMQTEMILRINDLETSQADVRTKLAATEAALDKLTAKRKEDVAAKESTIEDLNAKITYMAQEIENTLNVNIKKNATMLIGYRRQWTR